MSRSSRKRDADDGLVTGPVRIDRSPMVLARRLRAGDVAIVDVLDLDSGSAEVLAAQRPAAVVNVSHSISGRYPAGGPRVLLEAGIPLVDAVGPSVLDLKEGTSAQVRGNEVVVDDTVVASGTELDIDAITDAMQGAAEGMRVQLQMLTATAMEQIAREGDVLLEAQGLPSTGVDFTGRHVVIVAPGFRHREQLKEIGRYLRDVRPLVIGVGAGADAARDLGPGASVIVGDIEAIHEESVRAARHVVLHDPHGTDAGLIRAEALGVDHSTVDSTLSAADLAILMAHAGGAEVIVTVGVESRLMDFLERTPAEAAGTLLSRLRAGGRLVDATTLALVYRHRYGSWTLAVLMMSALIALGAAVWITPAGRAWVQSVWDAVTAWIGGA
ncbi:putative cytokinetic ring protein SteA [Demequina globuliformis]|uniref:putative cytokinetic ring protein SteA n=1 Tax=Demequina globuliformis TaxID=676202 RepID=UPI000783B8C1|nr:putative cytokinetic ring protein SteA [Demequina globuliformis]